MMRQDGITLKAITVVTIYDGPAAYDVFNALQTVKLLRQYNF